MSPMMFWTESPAPHHHTSSPPLSSLTNVFSGSSWIVPDPSQDKLRVPNNFQDELQDQSPQEPVHPVVYVVSAPEEVEHEAEDD